MAGLDQCRGWEESILLILADSSSMQRCRSSCSESDRGLPFPRSVSAFAVSSPVVDLDRLWCARWVYRYRTCSGQAAETSIGIDGTCSLIASNTRISDRLRNSASSGLPASVKRMKPCRCKHSCYHSRCRQLQRRTQRYPGGVCCLG